MRRHVVLLLILAFTLGSGPSPGFADICTPDNNCFDDVPLVHAHIQPNAPQRRITFGIGGTGDETGARQIFCGGIDSCRGHLWVLGMDHGEFGFTLFLTERDAKILVPWLVTPVQPWPTWGCTYVDPENFIEPVYECAIEE